MNEVTCKKQNIIKRALREFRDEVNALSNKPYLFVFDTNKNVLAFNLPSDNDEELNNWLYDENGNNRGGYGVQIDNSKNYIKFNTIEDAQKWYDERNEKHLLKATKNDVYPNLSNISRQIRKLKNVNYQDINRGSCFKFAKEISKLGYKKFTFIFSEEEQEVIHVYIKLTENLYWDALGFHKKTEIKSDYEIGKNNSMYDATINELNHYCNIDTYQSLTTIPISDPEWKEIIQIIKLNKK